MMTVDMNEGIIGSMKELGMSPLISDVLNLSATMFFDTLVGWASQDPYVL